MAEQLVSLNHPELQLLELVEEYPAWVAGVVDGASWMGANKWNYDYSPEVWADALDRLLAAGFVVIGEQESPDAPLRPTRDQILKELTRTDVTFDAFDTRKAAPPPWGYGFTPAGATVWEQFARPDWDRYIDESYPSEDSSGRPQEMGVVTSARRDCVEAFLREAHHLGVVIDHDTVRWTEIRPFEVRYWKSLPMGHRAEFVVLKNKGPDWLQVPHGVMWLRERWRHRGF